MKSPHEELIHDHQCLQARVLELVGTIDRLKRELAHEKRAKTDRPQSLDSVSEITDAAPRFIPYTNAHSSATTGLDLADSIGKCDQKMHGVASLGMSWETYRAMLEARQPLRQPRQRR